jgi:hypothetical protein
MSRAAATLSQQTADTHSLFTAVLNETTGILNRASSCGDAVHCACGDSMRRQELRRHC